jgi:PRC-barrel domain
MLQVRELHGSAAPGADEARGWIGNRVEDVYGAGIGRVEDVLVDGEGKPTWLIVREGRFTTNVAALPFDGALGSPGHVWVPHSKDAIKSSPRIPASGQFTLDFERELTEHYARAAAATREIR